MIDFGMATCLAAGGIGALVFLKIVCDEVIVKHRLLEMRLEAQAEAQRIAEQDRAKRSQGVPTVGEAEEVVTIEAA